MTTGTWHYLAPLLRSQKNPRSRLLELLLQESCPGNRLEYAVANDIHLGKAPLKLALLNRCVVTKALRVLILVDHISLPRLAVSGEQPPCGCVSYLTS